MTQKGIGATSPLSLSGTFDGKSILLIGGTGFLGKVWWTLLLDRFPRIKCIYLVVRSRPGGTAEERFWQEVAPNPGLDPLRKRHGDGFTRFLQEKISVLDGDITKPFCGVSESRRKELRGQVDVVANAAGIVDFQPPLDLALEVNALGCRNLVELSRDLGDLPVLHTSTCFVAGYQTGIVEECNPLEHPFPFAGKLERAHWDADREISECLDIVAQAKQRADDAFRQSAYLAGAKANLRDRDEPGRGDALSDEVQVVRRRFVEGQLAKFGQERAQFWGWPNTYTYTKSIGEQVVAASGLAFTIVRPAIVESCIDFPVAGWNEGINTSAPLIYAIREGLPQFPGGDVRLDIIPCDLVATGMTLALAELLCGEAEPVYQFGLGDSNPVSMARIYELSGLYKRRHFQSTGRGGPVENFLQRHIEGAYVSPKAFERFGPLALARGANACAEMLEGTPTGPFSALVAPTAKKLRGFAKVQGKINHIIGQFIPFLAELDYEFRCDNTRRAFQRLSEEERASLYWSPEKLDWREWFLEVHVTGLEKWVFPNLEAKLRKPKKPRRQHETVTQLLAEMAERFSLRVALQQTTADGLTSLSYTEVFERAAVCAQRLAAGGVGSGSRVLLLANNQSDWVIAFFGILACGAAVVPVAPGSVEPKLGVLSQASRAKFAVIEREALPAAAPEEGFHVFSIAEVTAAGDVAAPSDAHLLPGDIAVVHVELGTEEQQPRLSYFTHANLMSQVASLGAVIPMNQGDRLLSVLPLADLVELTCGLLLPLSNGARVVYPAGNDAEAVTSALSAGRITIVVGGAGIWESVQERARARVEHQGRIGAKAFKLALGLNKSMSRGLGLEAGRLLFGALHRELGGYLRYVVNTGGVLDPDTRRLFSGIGIVVDDLFGVASLVPSLMITRNRASGSGRLIPGLKVKLMSTRADGSGEVAVQGACVGFPDDPKAKSESETEAQPWQAINYLGKLDSRGQLEIMGRLEDCAEVAAE